MENKKVITPKKKTIKKIDTPVVKKASEVKKDVKLADKTVKTTKPVVSNKVFTAVGRRKTAIAVVKIEPGTGKYTINNKEIANPNRIYSAPLKLTGTDKNIDCTIKVIGGGLSGQIEAIRLGISRAIIKMDPELRKTLKVEGYLTRDQRMKERKKPGLKGARRAPQWAKR